MTYYFACNADAKDKQPNPDELKRAVKELEEKNAVSNNGQT